MKSDFAKIYSTYWQHERENKKSNIANILALRTQFYAGYIGAFVLINEYTNNI